MKKLWIAFIVVATYGSIYPFNFQAGGLDAATFGKFLQSCCYMASRGDILGNVVLFVPFGFTGMLGLRPDSPVTQRFYYVCVLGAVFALTLQVAQIYLPSRDQNLQDVLWNLLGTASGATLAGLLRQYASPTEGGKAAISLVPMTLISTWLAYRLIPFVPSFDFQSIKDSLKPLLNPTLAPINVIHDFSAWIIVAYLLRFAQRGVRLDSYLLTLILAVFCLEVLIVNNTISASNLLGALLAVLIWRSVLQTVRWQVSALVFFLLCALVLTRLVPFVTSFDPIPFNWLPFHGFLGDSMYLNVQSAAEKVFLYGSLVYLMWRAVSNRLLSIGIGAALVTMIEIAQTRLVGHTPEITDPLLVIFAALALIALESQDKKAAPGGRTSQRWVQQTINLREYQFEFLARMSQQMEVSVSRVSRRIIADFVDGLEQEAASKVAAEEGMSHTAIIAAAGDRERWVTQTINLHRNQFDFLARLAEEMGISVSRVSRRIITQFIAQLEQDDQMNSSQPL